MRRTVTILVLAVLLALPVSGGAQELLELDTDRQDVWLQSSFTMYCERRGIDSELVADNGEIAIRFTVGASDDDRDAFARDHGVTLRDDLTQSENYVVATLPSVDGQRDVTSYLQALNAALNDERTAFATPVFSDSVTGMREAVTDRISVRFRGDLTRESVIDYLKTLGFADPNPQRASDTDPWTVALWVTGRTGRDVFGYLLALDWRFNPRVVGVDPTLVSFVPILSVTTSHEPIVAPTAYPTGVVHDAFRVRIVVSLDTASITIPVEAWEDIETLTASAAENRAVIEEENSSQDPDEAEWAPIALERDKRVNFDSAWFAIMDGPTVTERSSNRSDYRTLELSFVVQLDRAGMVLLPPLELPYQFSSRLADAQQEETLKTPPIRVQVASLLPFEATTAPEPTVSDRAEVFHVPVTFLESLSVALLLVLACVLAGALLSLVYSVVSRRRDTASTTDAPSDWRQQVEDAFDGPDRNLKRGLLRAIRALVAQRLGVQLPNGTTAARVEDELRDAPYDAVATIRDVMYTVERTDPSDLREQRNGIVDDLQCLAQKDGTLS